MVPGEQPGLCSSWCAPRLGHTRHLLLNLLFVLPIEEIVQPDAMDKSLYNFPRAARMPRELRLRRMEPCQIRRRNAVAVRDVSADFSHHQRLRTSKAPGTNPRKLRRVQNASERMFSRRSKPATGRLGFEFWFEPSDFMHSAKYTSVPESRLALKRAMTRAGRNWRETLFFSALTPRATSQ